MSGIDPGKLGEWFDAWAARLALYARQFPAGAAAEDVVQDVFVRLSTLSQPPANVKAWLFAAVRNAAISAGRSRQRRLARERESAEARPAWFEPDPAGRIDAQAAREALEGLPERDREIVVLRIWGQLTLAEVAEVMGMPLSTVHEQYHNALEQLRARMESPCRK